MYVVDVVEALEAVEVDEFAVLTEVTLGVVQVLDDAPTTEKRRRIAVHGSRILATGTGNPFVPASTTNTAPRSLPFAPSEPVTT